MIILRNWGAQGTWINHTVRQPFRTLFSSSVTQTCCVWENISCPTQGEKLYLLEVNFLKHNCWSQQLDF